MNYPGSFSQKSGLNPSLMAPDSVCQQILNYVNFKQS